MSELKWEDAVPEPKPPTKRVATCGLCGSELKRDKALDTVTHLGYRCSRCRLTESRARPKPEAKK